MFTKASTYIHNESGEVQFLPEGSELSDHVLSQVDNHEVTGIFVEEPAEEKKTPARKNARSRAGSK